MYYEYNNNFARASRFFVHFFTVTTRLQSSIFFFFFFMGDVNKRRQILPLFEFLGIQLPESWPTFDAKKIERTLIPF